MSIFNCISGFKFDQQVKQRLEEIRTDDILGEAEAYARVRQEGFLRSTIMGMSYWEKALTYRYYTYLVTYIANKIKKYMGIPK